MLDGSGPRPALIGSTGHHAQVLLLTITDKEFPVARSVLESIQTMVEVGQTGAYTFENCVSRTDLPFVLVQAAARANLYAASSVSKWIRLFRPQYVLVIGTAGGIQRPTGRKGSPSGWKGINSGDVVISEYVHYAEFKKIASGGNLMRYMPIEQPSVLLVEQARAVIADSMWADLISRSFQVGDYRRPAATIEEVLSGEAVQDNPLDPMQQFLMKHFDRAGAVEMESAGVGQFLHSTRETVHYAPGFLAIRGISDIVYARGQARKLKLKDLPKAATEKTEERDDWSAAAAAAAAAFAIALTSRLVKGGHPPYAGHPAIDGYVISQLEGLSESADSLGS